jgi:hypothetical protein
VAREMPGAKLPSHHRLAWPTLLVMREFGRPVHNSEILQGVARKLQLSPELVSEPLGKGKRTRLEYKLSWARTLLKGIGAVELVEPAVWRVTSRGEVVTEADIALASQSMLAHLTSNRPPGKAT